MRLWSTCIFMALLLALPAARAQAESTGTIVGTVLDAEEGMVLDHAQVYIAALNRNAVWGADGRFTLAEVPAGAHRLSAELVGYEGAGTTVVVVAGETTTVELELIARAVELEEVVVTGTAFKESPINLPYAVAVTGRDKMAEQGSPQPVDFFKNLGASHGVIGEANSWYNDQSVSVPETVANVNLRGLGASRTLVLINSRRQVYLPARLFGGRFVDVNAIPSIALDRVEVLKEGASAIYGSDAVAGVANFVTRDDFTGFEVAAGHDYFANAGDSNAGAIWGGKIGTAHAVISAEWMGREELSAPERTYTLHNYPVSFWGWSGVGNPGAFITPTLTGEEDEDEFVQALLNAPRFVDPRCGDLGGYPASSTCRFRYQPWDILIEKQRHFRTFSEINGPLGNRTSYHLEVLWADTYMPHYSTTPSFPPVSPFNGNQLVEAGNPGRQAFCNSSYAADAGFASAEECLQDDWYFSGRLVGNAGPGRQLSRRSSTGRLAGSITHDLQLANRDAHFDLGLSYSQSSGNMNQPAEYAYRKFLAFRGFGGPDCGVAVGADPTAPEGMRLGPLNGQVAGQGDCMYYNPFSNAIEVAGQSPIGLDPATFTLAGETNPDYGPGLENSPELIGWINEEVDLENDAALLVGDATLTGTLRENAYLNASYALGYQFRHLNVSAQPNEPGDLSINPCLIPGDRSCLDETGRQIGFGSGPFTFTNGYYPYEDDQAVHRVFGELPLSLGSRFDAQLVANYEFHKEASSFNPKAAVRYRLSESAAHSLDLRGSAQTTFRTPSVDDLNTDVRTTLEYINPVGVYKAVDAYGNTDLEPEEAFTYNVGAVLIAKPDIDVTFDYWSYDFKNVIATLPQDDVVQLYVDGHSDAGDAEVKLNAVKERISCPGNVADGSCAPGDIERVRIDLINWPGVKTSGLDWHLGARFNAGSGQLSGSVDGTYTREYYMKALRVDDIEYRAALEGAGYYNRSHPLASPIPKWKWRGSAGYHYGNYSLVNYLNYVSAYEDRYVWAPDSFKLIDSFLTWDVNLLWRLPKLGMNITFSALNLTDAEPPPVYFELAFDGLTHNPKGRRFKLGVTYQFGG